jgi:hypothetical protein
MTPSGRVYGVFTTGASLVRMSAVCVYRMVDIDTVFEAGRLMAQRGAHHTTDAAHSAQVSALTITHN